MRGGIEGVGKGRKERGSKFCPRLFFFFLPSVKPSLTNNSIVNSELIVFSFVLGYFYCGLILFTQLLVAKGSRTSHQNPTPNCCC
jgi:hypothetical protein